MLRFLFFMICSFLVLCNFGFAGNSNYCISRTTIVNYNPCFAEVQKQAKGATVINSVSYKTINGAKIPQAPNKIINSSKILIQSYSPLTKHP